MDVIHVRKQPWVVKLAGPMQGNDLTPEFLQALASILSKLAELKLVAPPLLSATNLHLSS